MPKPVNETVGHCECRTKGCSNVADVRHQKGHPNGARYIVCPVHGVDRATGNRDAQSALDEWIDKTWVEGADADAKREEQQEQTLMTQKSKPPAQGREKSPENPAPRSGWFGWDLDDI